MKVLLVNGSPHKEGCTYTALNQVAETLEEEGIETEIFWIKNKPIGGCIACKTCAKAGKVNVFQYKPAATVISARRAGTTATYDQLNKYFGITQMPIISSRYWNMVHGATPEDVIKDEEGMQVMRILGRNMAYYLKCIEVGKEKGIELPKQEETTFTNFIR